MRISKSCTENFDICTVHPKDTRDKKLSMKDDKWRNQSQTGIMCKFRYAHKWNTLKFIEDKTN